MIKGEVKIKILESLREPKTFMEIYRSTGIAQSSIAKFLSEFIKDGFVKKEDGKYSLTEKGKDALEQDSVQKSALAKFKSLKIKFPSKKVSEEEIGVFLNFALKILVLRSFIIIDLPLTKLKEEGRYVFGVYSNEDMISYITTINLIIEEMADFIESKSIAFLKINLSEKLKDEMESIKQKIATLDKLFSLEYNVLLLASAKLSIIKLFATELLNHINELKTYFKEDPMIDYFEISLSQLKSICERIGVLEEKSIIVKEYMRVLSSF
ncbi:MAG: winged helix-turn-helix domain-containing protein [Nitrososphaeria archaeon]